MKQNLAETVVGHIRGGVGVPVTPAPQRRGSDAIVYRWFPMSGDGTTVSGRLELRFTSLRFDTALSRLGDVRALLMGEGGSYSIGDGAEKIIIKETPCGAGSGYARGCGLYFVKTGFEIQGRGDIYD